MHRRVMKEKEEVSGPLVVFLILVPVPEQCHRAGREQAWQRAERVSRTIPRLVCQQPFRPRRGAGNVFLGQLAEEWVRIAENVIYAHQHSLINRQAGIKNS